MLSTRALFLSGLMSLGAAGVVLPANAQQVFRIVGPDGRVSFSDKAPVETSPRGASGQGTTSTEAAASGGGQLPFELRQVAVKYPVTLYTGANCGPCGAGKALLSSRGVPFTEKTVNSNDDVNALQRLAGDSSLPLLTIGGQQLKGYSDTEWLQYLDAAGYPKSSLLPASYRNVPAAPLVAIQRPAATADGTAAGSAEGAPAAGGRRAGQGGAATTPAPPAPSNPAGIRF